ncbi:MAG: hypothetical protein LBR51_01825 [Bacteroidales bacterium]|nr:hypothetical protein [Bacteroidales bacterium]
MQKYNEELSPDFDIEIVENETIPSSLFDDFENIDDMESVVDDCLFILLVSEKKSQKKKMLKSLKQRMGDHNIFKYIELKIEFEEDGKPIVNNKDTVSFLEQSPDYLLFKIRRYAIMLDENFDNQPALETFRKLLVNTSLPVTSYEFSDFAATYFRLFFGVHKEFEIEKLISFTVLTVDSNQLCGQKALFLIIAIQMRILAWVEKKLKPRARN